jgi:tRNA A37 threonylcarbamoyladenosine modification protein TsaB
MRGMALALKIPLKAYGTLQVMAQAALSDAKLIVAVDARRDTYYVQSFAAQENGFRAPLSDPQALSAQAAAALISDKEFALLGSGAQALAQAVSQASKAKTHIDEAADFPDALHVARLAEVDADWQEGALPLPLYLRPPDATLPRRDKFPTRAPSDETGN